MDKRKAFEDVKNIVIKVLNIRRIIKMAVAVFTGIAAGAEMYSRCSGTFDYELYSFGLAFLVGAMVTGIMLLIMKIIGALIAKAIKLGTDLLSKYKEKRKNSKQKSRTK